LYAGPFFAALSFAAYLFTAIYVAEDKKDVDNYIKMHKTQAATAALIADGGGQQQHLKATSSNESTLNEECETRGDDTNNPISTQSNLINRDREAIVNNSSIN
jgi:uncharacterized membrane protein YcaP (DUF421 family)